MVDLAVADARRRRAGAAAHAGRPHDANWLSGRPLRQVHRTASSAPASMQLIEFADPDRQRRRSRLAFPDDVEMVVEGGDLVDLGLGQPHVVGQRAQMGGRQATVARPGSDAGTRSADRAARPRSAQKRPDLGERTDHPAPALLVRDPVLAVPALSYSLLPWRPRSRSAPATMCVSRSQSGDLGSRTWHTIDLHTAEPNAGLTILADRGADRTDLRPDLSHGLYRQRFRLLDQKIMSIAVALRSSRGGRPFRRSDWECRSPPADRCSGLQVAHLALCR